MNRCMIGIGVVLMACFMAVPAYAGYDQAFGEIKSFDADAGKLVVAVRMGRDAEPKDTTYLVDKDTTIRVGREKGTVANLTVGKRVNIVFKEAEGGGDPTALLISVTERRMGGPGGRGDQGGQ